MSSPSKILPAGTPAPDFTLKSAPDETASLRDFRGSPLILVFYPVDWSPVCGDELALFNEVQPEFQRLGAQVVGVSVDGVWRHRAFAEARNLRFPLLSDFEPKGQVSRAYGAYLPEAGTSARATFLVDGEGVVAWSCLSPAGVNPGVNGVLTALEELVPQEAPAR